MRQAFRNSIMKFQGEMVKSNFFSEKAPAELTTAAAENLVCTDGGFSGTY